MSLQGGENRRVLEEFIPYTSLVRVGNFLPYFNTAPVPDKLGKVTIDATDYLLSPATIADSITEIGVVEPTLKEESTDIQRVQTKKLPIGVEHYLFNTFNVSSQHLENVIKDALLHQARYELLQYLIFHENRGVNLFLTDFNTIIMRSEYASNPLVSSTDRIGTSPNRQFSFLDTIIAKIRTAKISKSLQTNNPIFIGSTRRMAELQIEAEDYKEYTRTHYIKALDGIETIENDSRCVNFIPTSEPIGYSNVNGRVRSNANNPSIEAEFVLFVQPKSPNIILGVSEPQIKRTKEIIYGEIKYFCIVKDAEKTLGLIVGKQFV